MYLLPPGGQYRNFCVMSSHGLSDTHIPGGEAFVYPLPQTAVLLDRQMDWSVDGWHTAYGGGDKEGAGWGEWKLYTALVLWVKAAMTLIKVWHVTFLHLQECHSHYDNKYFPIFILKSLWKAEDFFGKLQTKAFHFTALEETRNVK